MLLPKDYLRMRLTGRIGAEPSDASSTLLFDTAQRVWNRPLLDELGIDPGLLPPLSEGWQVAGGLLEECAAAIGLPAGTPVVFGSADAAAQALGLGVIEPGVLACLISSGGQLITPLAAPIYDAGLCMHTFCHAAPHRWYLEAATLSAGLSLRWLRDRIYPGSSYQQLADWAERSGSPAGLFFLPHLTGERTPYMDPQSRACFYGLGPEHDGGSLVRAVMEGVVYSLRQCLDLMEGVAGRVERVVASGGGARHPLWLRLMADIFDRPIYRSESLEGAALGAAMLAGVGCGLYADVQSACAESVHWSQVAIQPEPAAVERYAAAYPVFLRLYPAARSVRNPEGKDEQYPLRKGE